MTVGRIRSWVGRIRRPSINDRSFTRRRIGGAQAKVRPLAHRSINGGSQAKVRLYFLISAMSEGMFTCPREPEPPGYGS